jgi:hypothetical protein
VGETILFPTFLFTFSVHDGPDGVVRVGSCYPGIDLEQAHFLSAFIEATFIHVNACSCSEHEDVEAELGIY